MVQLVREDPEYSTQFYAPGSVLLVDENDSDSEPDENGSNATPDENGSNSKPDDVDDAIFIPISGLLTAVACSSPQSTKRRSGGYTMELHKDVPSSPEAVSWAAFDVKARTKTQDMPTPVPFPGQYYRAKSFNMTRRAINSVMLQGERQYWRTAALNDMMPLNNQVVLESTLNQTELVPGCDDIMGIPAWTYTSPFANPTHLGAL
ncbi:MAG: hypothetical protein BYD32DRAFT_437168 [Podila humilis]|nr:MAG: hypothetical protein BYD32DRAFT_437168 [Podila humilis]